jgi:hypothetical protein
MSDELQEFLKGTTKFQMTDSKFWFNLMKHKDLSREQLHQTFTELLSKVFEVDGYTLQFESCRYFRCTIQFQNPTDVALLQKTFTDITRLG